MSEDNNQTPSGWSIFMPLLAVSFITLKLAGYITWSWLWVLAPIWGPIVVTFLIVIPVLSILALKGKL